MIFKEVNRLLRLKSIQDAILNLGGYFVVILCGVISSSILVNGLGVDNYGKLGLVTSIIGFLSIFIGFGYFNGYCQVLLKESNKIKQREIIGLGIKIWGVMLILFWGLIVIALPLIWLIYKDLNLLKVLALTSFLAVFFISGLFVVHTTRNSHNMRLQAVYTGLQPVLYLSSIFVLIYFNLLNYYFVFIISNLSFLISAIFVFYFIKPIFKNHQKWWREIKKSRQSFGKHIYQSQLFERITFNLDRLMLGYFSYSFVGIYGLASMLVQPIGVFSNKLSDAILKDFIKQKNIPIKVFIYNFFWWLCCSMGLLIIAKFIILLIWNSEFLVILDFLWIFILATLFSNIYYLLYLFLYAKGVGKKLKKHFYIRGTINVIGNLILIPIFGITGAVFATMISNFGFMSGLFWEYKKYTKYIK